jgi:NAD(P)-dependent dehydrogenase (short-subunit alcohol dehydrogenase family)
MFCRANKTFWTQCGLSKSKPVEVEQMIDRFNHKIVVITGGGKGIGRACAERFVSEGARVAVLDISLADAQATSTAIGDANCLAVYCNVADHESVHDSIRQVLDHWGRVDVLVANAGVYRGAPLTEDHLKDWQLVMDVDLTGAYLSCHAVAPVMMAQNSGSIVVMSSMAGKTSWSGTAAYSAAKTGGIGLVRSVAQELGPYNVNCNAVCLGHADTEMMRAVDARVCAENGWNPGSYMHELAESNPMWKKPPPWWHFWLQTKRATSTARRSKSMAEGSCPDGIYRLPRLLV